MIRNTIVANIKSNNNDQELRIILTEYERRLKDMENDSQQSGLKLRQIIDNLMKEKDELSTRLIKVNNLKLLVNHNNSEVNSSDSTTKDLC